jgi:hypothetical protein
MHPQKTHQTTGAPDSALRLGFTDIKPESTKKSRRAAQHDDTPSKVNVPSSAFTFRVSPRGARSELSHEAQAMMAELREKSDKIKADLVAQREADGEGDSDRKIIKPKGKSSRFSAAHMAEFKKMDSIENHASAWRAQEGRFTPVKKTSSSVNQDSASRVHEDRLTPVKSAYKPLPSSPFQLDVAPTPTKSAITAVDTTPTPARVGLKRNIEAPKGALDSTPLSRSKRGLKRKSEAVDVDKSMEPASKTAIPASSSKIGLFNRSIQQSSAKRTKHRLEDDTSVARPVSRDGSSIPQFAPTSSALLRSKSSLARLTSPTKASLAHTSGHEKPTVSLVPQPIPQPNFGGLPKSASSLSVTSPSLVSELKRRIISPGRFQKVKSILKGTKTDVSAIPLPTISVSQTPGPKSTERTLFEGPAVPWTTPRRKIVKRVTFTPSVKKEAAVAQNSPSPQKFGSSKFRFGRNANDSQFPSIANVMAPAVSDQVFYPDLSSLENEVLGATAAKSDESPSKPGTFTFRSDHTIKFGAPSPTGFGPSAGQSSVRQVRSSVAPAQMPGAFPDVSKGSVADKENDPPHELLVVPHGLTNKKRHRAGSDEEDEEPTASPMVPGVPHGMSNKKRHRAVSDEEDAEREASERAAKKRKNETVPDGQVILKTRPLGTTPLSSTKTAARGVNQTPSKMSFGTPSKTALGTPSKTPLRTPSQVPASASAAKKRSMLSISRLNMLARPKNRA